MFTKKDVDGGIDRGGFWDNGNILYLDWGRGLNG